MSKAGQVQTAWCLGVPRGSCFLGYEGSPDSHMEGHVTSQAPSYLRWVHRSISSLTGIDGGTAVKVRAEDHKVSWGLGLKCLGDIWAWWPKAADGAVLVLQRTFWKGELRGSPLVVSGHRVAALQGGKGAGWEKEGTPPLRGQQEGRGASKRSERSQAVLKRKTREGTKPS